LGNVLVFFEESMAKDVRPRMSLPSRVAYGVGELAGAIPVSLAAFFLLYFLTTVVGLSPALAGSVLLLGRVWDAVNDPVVGWLSDGQGPTLWGHRTHSPLGRRYPWMVYGAVPLALGCVLLWWVPPLEGQGSLFAYYALLSVGIYLAFTAVQLPYTALAAELSDDYDERTSLIGFKSAFSIGGSLLGLVLAQIIFAQVAQPRQQYFLLGLVSGGIALVAIAICVLGTYRRYWQMEAQRRQRPRAASWSLANQIQSLWQNVAFRQVLGLYLFAWMGIQVTAAMLPYFVAAWMGLPETHFAQMALTVQGTAIVSMAGWGWLGKRTEKRTIFLAGAPISGVCLLGLVTVQPGQIAWMYALAAGVGLGLATLYLVPFAMLPDVIDLDELQTGHRREGVYFSAVVFLQKLGLAIALFLSGQVLNWTGLTADATAQPPSALWAIRLLIGPLPALLVAGSLWFAYRYPLSRQQHQEIVLKLQAQQSE
jgi:glycoside/pentoside/hexuronide:cation symporter, GPH family